MSAARTNKPPLGLRPKFIADRHRMIEIFEAILRYVDADKKVPKKWIKELNVLIKEQP